MPRHKLPPEIKKRPVIATVDPEIDDAITAYCEDPANKKPTVSSVVSTALRGCALLAPYLKTPVEKKKPEPINTDTSNNNIVISKQVNDRDATDVGFAPRD